MRGEREKTASPPAPAAGPLPASLPARPRGGRGKRRSPSPSARGGGGQGRGRTPGARADGKGAPPGREVPPRPRAPALLLSHSSPAPSAPPSLTCISCISSDRNSSMPMVPDIARPRARAASPGRDDADAMEKDSTTGRPRAGACGGGGCDGCADAVSSRGSGTRRRRGGSTDTVAGVWVAGRGGGGARGVWGGSAGASGAENEKWGGGRRHARRGSESRLEFFFPLLPRSPPPHAKHTQCAAPRPPSWPGRPPPPSA